MERFASDRQPSGLSAVEKFAPGRNAPCSSILACSGGAARGLYQLLILEEIQRRAGIPFYELFDVSTSNSTSSPFAAYLALNPRGITDPMQVLPALIEGYQQLAPEILKVRPIKSKGHLFAAEPMKDALRQFFGEIKLGDIEKPMVIATTKWDKRLTPALIANFEVSEELAGLGLVDGREHKVVDVVAASMAAPFLFQPVEIDDHKYVDGGMFQYFPLQLAIGIDEYLHKDEDRKGKPLVFGLASGFVPAKTNPMAAMPEGQATTDEMLFELQRHKYHPDSLIINDTLADLDLADPPGEFAFKGTEKYLAQVKAAASKQIENYDTELQNFADAAVARYKARQQGVDKQTGQGGRSR